MSFLISSRLPFILINLNESSAVIIFELSLVIELLKAGPSKTSMVSLGAVSYTHLTLPTTD